MVSNSNSNSNWMLLASYIHVVFREFRGRNYNHVGKSYHVHQIMFYNVRSIHLNTLFTLLLMLFYIYVLGRKHILSKGSQLWKAR
jgi:hypothetical protein